MKLFWIVDSHLYVIRCGESGSKRSWKPQNTYVHYYTSDQFTKITSLRDQSCDEPSPRRGIRQDPERVS